MKGEGREAATSYPWGLSTGNKRTSQYTKDQEPEGQRDEGSGSVDNEAGVQENMPLPQLGLLRGLRGVVTHIPLCLRPQVGKKCYVGREGVAFKLMSLNEPHQNNITGPIQVA